MKEDTLWAEKGHIIACEQFELPFTPIYSFPAPEKVENKSSLSAENAFLSLDGKEIITKVPSLNIMRATLDNDGVSWALQYHMTAKPLVRWHDKGLYQGKMESAILENDPEKLVLEDRFATPCSKERILLNQKYLMQENGAVKGEALFSVPEFFRDLPRLGLLFTLPGSFEKVEYFGKGPFENYCDRNSGAKKGLYCTTVDEMYTPYIMPQEYGNRTEVKYFALYSPSMDITLLFHTPAGAEFSVSRYSYEMLEKAQHTNELSPSENIYLKLDYFQRGVGSVSCGPDANEEYRTQWGDFLLRFKMKAIKGKIKDISAEIRKM